MRKYVRYLGKKEFEDFVSRMAFGAAFADHHYTAKGIPNVITSMNPYKITCLKNENKPVVKRKKKIRKKKKIRRKKENAR